MPSEKFLELMEKKRKEKKSKDNDEYKFKVPENIGITEPKERFVIPEQKTIKEPLKEFFVPPMELPKEEILAEADKIKMELPEGSLKYEFGLMRFYLDKESWSRLTSFNASSVIRLALKELFDRYTNDEIYIKSRPYDYNNRRGRRKGVKHDKYNYKDNRKNSLER